MAQPERCKVYPSRRHQIRLRIVQIDALLPATRTLVSSMVRANVVCSLFPYI
jgi:hypothetical protein